MNARAMSPSWKLRFAAAAAVTAGVAVTLAWWALAGSPPDAETATTTTQTASAPSPLSSATTAALPTSTASVLSPPTTVPETVPSTTAAPKPPALPVSARAEWLVLPGSDDVPGALFERSRPRLASSGLEERPYDLCDIEDAKMTVAMRAPEPGEKLLLTLNEWDRVKQRRYGRGCDGTEPVEGYDHRYAIMELQIGSWHFFTTPQEALEWLNGLKAADRRRHRNTVPPDTRPLGINATGGFLLGQPGFTWNIVYADADADSPIDEVQVLAETLAVRDGVLRGLVRNWSRSLWAYGVTVTVDGKSWQWPLSVQPGETAPFEIDGWDGPADPDPARIAVTAHMSPYADITRAFEFEYAFPWSSKYEPEHKPKMPPEVEATFPSDEDYDGQSYHWRLVSHPVPLPAELWSHPSVNERLVGAEIEGLRAYVAYHDWKTGQVTGVEQLHLIGFDQVVDCLPYYHSDSPSSPRYGVWMTFDTPYDPDPYARADAYTVWLGGVHG